MTVTVSMGVYQLDAAVLLRAVRSVLAQTHRDLRLVLIGDGVEPPLPRFQDPRLAVYVTDVNRGCYFNHQLILESTPDDWFAVVDADDWVEPDHLERLLAMGRPVVPIGCWWFHELDGRPPFIKPCGPDGRHHGLYRTAHLRAVGGYDPHARLVQDTHLLEILRRFDPYELSPHATYHRVRRADSLTLDSATGMKSETRQRAREAGRLAMGIIQDLPDAEAVRAYRAAQVPADVRDALAHHADALRRQLAPPT